MNCEGCEKPMWLDYPIDDDIPLCHECYVSYAESGLTMIKPLKCWSCDAPLDLETGYHLVDGEPTCGDCED